MKKTNFHFGTRIAPLSRCVLIGTVTLVVGGHGLAATHYVDMNSTNPTPPYTNWATAATVLQDAVDTAAVGDEVVVTNGTYATGGWWSGWGGDDSNRVAALEALTIRSVNGPGVTVIDGAGSMRCVYLSAGSSISGFTLTNGYVGKQAGGGVFCEGPTALVSNCVIISNSVFGFSYDLSLVSGEGGGAYGGTLNNCTLIGNSVHGYIYIGLNIYFAAGLGGGAANCSLSDCVLIGNSAYAAVGDHADAPGHGGGAANCCLNNCLLVGNYADDAGGGAALVYDYSGDFNSGGMLNNCTLTWNSAELGGGAFQCMVTNCLLSNNVALGGWASGGGANSSTLVDCVLVGNSAEFGGGAFDCTLNACTLTNNSAAFGGGSDGSALSNCTLSGNVANYGGGASSSTLRDCVLTGNLSDYAEGGGAYNCSLNNCELIRNIATNVPFFSGGLGGGAAESTLTNCSLIGNFASDSGGGGGDSILSNCILIDNSAYNFGGGAFDSALFNCKLTGNSAVNWGGGVAFSTLNNCVLTSNAAEAGGGTLDSALNDSIVYFNSASEGANYLFSSPYPLPINYSCTTPVPVNGSGNITNAPLFMDLSAGNLRLQSNSPCINAGNNAYAPSGSDLDGNPRIASGTVDIGAYEFQNPDSIISYAWLQQYGLPTDGSVDFTDPDGDGMNNWQEWRVGTHPINALSVLRVISARPTGTNVVVTWQSVAGVNYLLERSTNLMAPVSYTAVATNILGMPGATTCFDTNATGSSLFYRVGVR